MVNKKFEISEQIHQYKSYLSVRLIAPSLSQSILSLYLKSKPENESRGADY